MSVSGTSAPALQVRKRSGKIVDYKKQKIMQAVRLCLINGCRRDDNAETTELATCVSERVEQILRTVHGPANVETIQNLVEQVLMALDEHDAAKQYIIYREEHRKLREAAEVDQVAEQAIRNDRRHFITDAQIFQHYDKYARFNDVAKRRETFMESTTRQIDYLRWEVEERHGRRGVVTAAEWSKLHLYLLQGDATPSMRLQQTAGPAAKRCNVGIYNCSFAALKDLDYFHEGLYVSMAGTGHAFSCETEFVEQLPQIKRQRAGYTPDNYVIEDSTEAWCRSVRDLSYALYDGYDLDIDYSLIRRAGARLHTKGGTSSGPGVLIQLHQNMRRLIKARQGRRLRDIDAHDWMCFIGNAGQMGGFRRAAELSLSDLNSMEMRLAKYGEFYKDPTRIQRTISNNSAAYNEKPDPFVFLDEWISLAKSRSGERGIFNRGSIPFQIPERRRKMYEGQNVAFGTNPCFAPGTMVHTRAGHFPIEKLVGKTVEVWNGVAWCKVDNFRVTGRNQPVMAVRTLNGFDVRCTRQHTFILEDNSRIKAEDLKLGMVLKRAGVPGVLDDEVDASSRRIVSLMEDGFSSEVYCCTVSDVHAFALSNGWLVGNCGEIFLHPDGQFCNLSIANCRPHDTEDTLMAKVETAAIFGTLQSLLTNFSYLRPRWKENCERERLLGVSLDGAVDCPLLRDTNPDRNNLLERLKAKVIKTNQLWATRLGIPASTATTCIKPGGNSSVRWYVGQAMSGWLTERMIRNVEVGNHNPMCRFLKDSGVPHEPSYRDATTTIFSFPLQAPTGAHIVADMILDAGGNVTGIKPRRSAIAQLEDWLAFKRHWTEHNPSVSVYVADDEWLKVGQWVWDHWDDVGGLAFFPLDGGVYPQAPMQPCSEAQFEVFTSRFPKIPWEKLPRYEQGVDHTSTHKELACAGKDGCLLN